MQESNYHEMYDRLWGMIIVLVLYLVLLFVTNGSKVIILLLWIMTMFALAAYLISLEYLNFELEKKLRHITQMEHDFGRNAADVVAEENLEKLRGFIAASPSLAGIIVDRIEAAQAKAAENAAHAAEAEEITAAEEPQETPFTQEEPQPAYASAEYEADVIETAEAAEEETYTAITEEEPSAPAAAEEAYAPAMPEESEAAVDTPAETAAVNTPDVAQDAPAASGEGERKEEAEVCV